MFEPFGGSGTTMLAAERTGRICCSVEIAPQCVDVAYQAVPAKPPWRACHLTPPANPSTRSPLNAKWRWRHELAGRQDRTVADRKLLPYARNARTHSEDQVAQIAPVSRSLIHHPILAGSDGIIVAERTLGRRPETWA